MKKLYADMFEANGDELMEVPRTKSGKVNVKALVGTPKDVIAGLRESGAISDDDLLRLSDKELATLGLDVSAENGIEAQDSHE